MRESGGYNLLALSLSGAQDDTRLIESLLHKFQSNEPPHGMEIGGLRFSAMGAYQRFVSVTAVEFAAVNSNLNNYFLQTVQADNRRNDLMGVVMDDELSNMMQYQFAYQAAARLFNIIDSMIDTVVNRMGRVGM